MKAYTDKYTKQGRISRILINGYFHAVQKLITHIDPIHSALEIGCGEGFSTARLRQLLPAGTHFSASEYEASQIEPAQKRNPGISIIQEDLFQTQREANSVDLVFLLEVLEHLSEPTVALQILKKISARYLILGVPNEPLWRILNFSRGKYWQDWGNTPGHINHFSSHALVALIEKEFGPVIHVCRPIPWTIVLAEKRSVIAHPAVPHIQHAIDVHQKKKSMQIGS